MKVVKPLELVIIRKLSLHFPTLLVSIQTKGCGSAEAISNAKLLSFGSTSQSPKNVTLASSSAKTLISRIGTGDSHVSKIVRPSFVI